jgi:predicted nucleic acid-binding protein
VIAYFDTSALLKIVLSEQGLEVATAAWQRAEFVVASAVIYPEARAATAAAVRHRRVKRAVAAAHLEFLVGEMDFVEPARDLLWHAGDLAERHRLRGYDAVHLASALRVAPDVMVAADVRLLNAARAERLKVLLPD